MSNVNAAGTSGLATMASWTKRLTGKRCPIRISTNENRARSLWIGIAIASLVYFLAICFYLSSRRILWYDELLAWNLLSDASWSHMLQSWNRGADSGGLLFYGLGRIVLEAAGMKVVAIRAALALALWVAALLWWKMLRRDFSPVLATFGTALIFFCTPTYLNYLAEVRFYSLLILTVTLAVYAAAWIERTQPSVAVAFMLCLVTHALLISSHMLGVIYSVAILAAILISSFPGRQRIASILGGVCAWSLLLLYRQASQSGATKLNWIVMPNVAALARFYFHNPTVYRLLDLVLIMVIAYAAFLAFKSGSVALRPQPFGMSFALVMLLVPAGFFVVSHVYKPLFAERYMMPYILGFAYIATWAFSTIGKRRPSKSDTLTIATAAAFLLVLHVQALRHQAVRPYSDIAPLVALQAPLPLVIPDDRTFLELKHEGASVKSSIAYLLPPMSDREKRESITTTLVEQGYANDIYENAAFIAQHPTFWYLNLPPNGWSPDPQILSNPALKETDAGVVTVAGVPTRLLLVERR